MSKRFVGVVVIVFIIAALGITAYQKVSTKRALAEAPATETAIVQRGDVSITVEAAGSLVSPTEITLAFPAAGKLYEIPVSEGQIVKQGDLLARLEGNLQAEADFQALFTDAGVTQVELAAANAQEFFDDALGDLKYRIGTNTYYWEGQLKQAEEALLILNTDVNASAEDKDEAQKVVDNARGKRDYFLYQNLQYLEKEDDYFVDDSDIAAARANLETAKVNLQDAQIVLEIVRTGSSALRSPLAALGPEMARLEQTRLNLENTRLLAITDSVITTLYYQVGEYANPGTPVVSLSNLSVLKAEVNLDETDVVRIALGMPVIVAVDAFPGVDITGEVTEIAPIANIQSGVVLYPVTIHLDATNLLLRSGMTVSVTFSIEKRTDTLLVPFRAVETEGGQAYLTRVTGLGNERVAVTLGLITDTQVEILSGIEAGDIVTVYANPVQDAEVMSNPMFGGGQ